MSGKRYLYPDEFEACDHCRGKGTVYCSTCDGKGYREVRRTLYDSSGRTITDRESCTICHGTGGRMCNDCGGTGDQRKYQTAEPDGDADVADPGDNESGYDPVRMKQKYSALYDAELERAVQKRDDIGQWIWSADAFSSEYKLSFTRWLDGLDLDHPDVPKLLDDAAEHLNQPGLATQVGSLRMMLGSLSSICSTAQTFKRMTK